VLKRYALVINSSLRASAPPRDPIILSHQTRAPVSDVKLTPASALRTVLFTTDQCGWTRQLPSIAQLWLPVSTHDVMAIGPSTASIISAKLIAAAGRASDIPPPVPRADRNRPALLNMLTSFCVVGSAIPVSFDKSVAEIRARFLPVAGSSPAPPQCRDAALIITTA
jgi:hypothetical protein